MQKFATITSIAAVIAAGALASIVSPADPARASSTARPLLRLTEAEIDAAVAEARTAGALKEDHTDSDGSRVVTIADASGHSIELATSNRHIDLSGGSDKYGLWVGFNSFDQQTVIGAGAAAVVTGLCFLGPAVCVVANVAVLLAANAVTSHGGVQCGSKSLRVYPVSGHKPRCA